MKPIIYLCGAIIAVTVAVVVWVGVINPRVKRDWRTTEKQDSISAYEEFLTHHAQSEYAPLASNKLARLHEVGVWSLLKENPSVTGLRSFQHEFPASANVPESLVMLTNLFYKKWEAIRSAFDHSRYLEFIAMNPPQDLESEAKFMLRVMERARDYRVTKLQITALKPSDITVGATNLTFHCKGPLNLGALSLPDGVPMQIDCVPGVLLQNEASANAPGEAILLWGLGGLPKASHIETEGIFLSGRQHPHAISFVDTNKSILLALKTGDGSLFTFNDGNKSDAFFTPVALLITRTNK